MLKAYYSKIMRLDILGSGTIAGQTNRNCSGYLVDENILIDCGPGIWQAFYSKDRHTKPLDIILISHFHIDHISDLIIFLWHRWVLNKDHKKDFSIYGPLGLKRWFSDLTHVHNEWINDLSISLHELSQSKIKIGSYKIETLPTKHSKNSICYKITDSKKRTLFYSGDSGWCENLIKLSNSCDMSIIESANTLSTQTDDHLTPELAGKIAELSGTKCLVLTHLYPEVFNINPREKASQFFKGEIIIASDNMVIMI